MCGTTVQLGSALLLAAVSLLFIALSFSTDNWIEIIVNRKKINETQSTDQNLFKSNQIFFTRNRGLFRTCFSDISDDFITTYAKELQGGACLPEKGYQVPYDDSTVSWGDDYKLHTHLMRAHFFFFAIAMLLLIITLILGATGCVRISPRVIKGASLIAFLAALFAACGMAFFQGYEFLEKSKLEVDNIFYAQWSKMYTVLNANHAYFYGWSYIIAWLGIGTTAFSAIIFLFAAFSIQDGQKLIDKKRQRELLGNDFGTLDQGRPRNKGYDYPMYHQQQDYHQYQPSTYPAYNYDYNGYPSYDTGYKY